MIDARSSKKGHRLGKMIGAKSCRGVHRPRICKTGGRLLATATVCIMAGAGFWSAWRIPQAWATPQVPSLPAVPHRRHGSFGGHAEGPRGSPALVGRTARPPNLHLEGHEEKSLKDNQVFAASYIAYASCYLARNNAAVAKAPLLATLGMGASIALWGTQAAMSATTALGMLDGVFLLAYTCGSFVVPAAIDLDEKSPWDVVWLALAVTGLAQLGLWWSWSSLLAPHFALPEFMAVCACCLVNGAAQSVLYPACKQVLADRFGSKGIVLGTWNTCYYLGGAVSTLCAAAFCDTLGWSAAYVGPSLLLLAIAGIGRSVASWPPPSRSEYVSSPEKTKSDGADVETADGTWTRTWRLIWPEYTELRYVALQYFVVKLVRYAFGLWLPLLLAAAWDVQDGGGLVGVGATAAIFELGSMFGSIALGSLVEWVGLGAMPLVVVGTTGAMAILLALVPYVLGASAGSSLGTWALLLLLGLSTGGGETLLGSISPIFYAKEAESQGSAYSTTVASAVASVNGYGSLGTVFAAVGLPLLSAGNDAMGLAGAFQTLAPFALVATCTALLQMRGGRIRPRISVERQH
mmetsp:Transcript_15331/g.42026  ORF Transcript_15331/g.42026 Transcript_15331/m.42026 type:complete len:577 (-) Transcript_15331:84-1814(-)